MNIRKKASIDYKKRFRTLTSIYKKLLQRFQECIHSYYNNNLLLLNLKPNSKNLKKFETGWNNITLSRIFNKGEMYLKSVAEYDIKSISISRCILIVWKNYQLKLIFWKLIFQTLLSFTNLIIWNHVFDYIQPYLVIIREKKRSFQQLENWQGSLKTKKCVFQINVKNSKLYLMIQDEKEAYGASE